MSPQANDRTWSPPGRWCATPSLPMIPRAPSWVWPPSAMPTNWSKWTQSQRSPDDWNESACGSPYGDGRRGSTPPGSNVADEAFRHLDQDGDGYLSADEFITAIVEYWSSDDPDAPGNWAMGRPAYER